MQKTYGTKHKEKSNRSSCEKKTSLLHERSGGIIVRLQAKEDEVYHLMDLKEWFSITDRTWQLF